MFWDKAMRQKLRSIHQLYFCLLLSLVVADSPAVNAQAGSIDDGILTLPYILAGDTAYSAELELISGELTQFSLLAAIETPINQSRLASTFADNLLFIPDINVNGLTYWAKLLIDENNVFTLTNFGMHSSVATENLLGLERQPTWLRVVGDANDVAVGADGSVWVVGLDPRNGGYGIYRWNGIDWNRVDGGAIRIAVDPQGNPWIVNDSHQVYRMIDGVWQRLPGDARDIAIGADGTVWVAAGGGIYRWNGIDWDRFSGSGVRIAVDPLGIPWVIDHTDDIHQQIAGHWVRRSGKARDIGVGADGSVWIVGTRNDNGGHGLYRWTGNAWNQVQGSARQISVDPDGYPWVVSSGGDIYRSE